MKEKEKNFTGQCALILTSILQLYNQEGTEKL